MNGIKEEGKQTLGKKKQGIESGEKKMGKGGKQNENKTERDIKKGEEKQKLISKRARRKERRESFVTGGKEINPGREKRKESKMEDT